ncbi:hypothetical protein [Alkalicoccus chagannorensis]|uniref:hypothetical protein n=1 Tax=Alkalicoccus chagannorensis TaxID=427072 RepID=UPI00047C8494|nr:hypothetical protein [Alkalicoccus chagannorensis]
MGRVISMLILLVLAGCGSTFDLEEPERVEIRGFDGFGTAGGEVLGTLSGTDAEEAADILDGANEQSGAVDMAEGDLHLVVGEEPERHFHLWLPEEGGGSVMEARDTHTLYSLSSGSTEDLRELLREADIAMEVRGE